MVRRGAVPPMRFLPHMHMNSSLFVLHSKKLFVLHLNIILTPMLRLKLSGWSEYMVDTPLPLPKW